MKFPSTDWDTVWENSCLKCFDSSMLSFAFKLIHDLLPYEARLSAIFPNTPAVCKYNCQEDPAADIEHVFFKCKFTKEVGEWLVDIVRSAEPQFTLISILKLELHRNDALMWIIVSTLQTIWVNRSKGHKMRLTEFYAKIIAELEILLQTKHYNIASVALQHIQCNIII